MTKVYQCDRCKTIFKPRVLAYGEPYIARKGKADLDLCPNCYNLFTDFINATSPGRASYVNYHTITVLENIKNRLLPSMTEENEALDKTIKAMMHEPFLADALNKAHAEIKEMDKRIEELKAAQKNTEIDEKPHGKCKSCRHRDPEDKKCDCGGLERLGCNFPVNDNYYCKYYEEVDND